VAAILLRRELKDEGLLILSGILSLMLGVLLAIRPQAGAIAFV
jgi:uncharacterized membrane protein HdeD (DUF308 family)